jgi:hypothetical protein
MIPGGWNSHHSVSKQRAFVVAIGIFAHAADLA